MAEQHNLESQIKSFSGLWEGGYYEGDPLNPMGTSNYGVLGFISSLYAIYLTCIKPYINEESMVCEIGCGRGAWTKTFLRAKEIWCLDALAPDYNKFWEYVGNHNHIRYYQVHDFSCDILPDAKFNYIFSFGCFCHISFEGITEYMKNIFPKLLYNAHGFIMVADYDKYNEAVVRKAEYGLQLLPQTLRPIYQILNGIKSILNLQSKLFNINEDNIIRPGRWYHAGIDRTCDMLKNLGYEIIEKDVNANIRDPIIHFIKP